MAITPINLTRVSHNLQTLSLLDSLRSNTLNLFLQQNRIGTGSKLNAPSEDPVTAAKAMQLTEILERQEQMLANIRHADTYLTATDTAVGEIHQLLIDAHDIALGMVDSGASSDERAAEAQLVLGIIDQLVTVGNREHGGTFLFAGFQTGAPPFTQDHGVAEYRGDLGQIQANVDVSQDPIINIHGADLFGALSNQVRGYVDLNPGLSLNTRLTDLDGASEAGVSRGLIRITLDSPATTFTVNLNSADTVGDVIDLINDAAEQAGLTVGPGNAFNAALNAAGNGFQIDVAAGSVTVAESGQGVAARDLGLLGSGAGSLVGLDVNAQLTPMTRIDTLYGGAGAALGDIQIDNGHLSATISLAGATTIQDIINRINTAGVEVVARINDAGTGIDIHNRASGMSMSIGEVGGNTADLLGIRSMRGSTPLSELNQGRGVTFSPGVDDLTIRTRNNVTFGVNLDDSRTVQDVLDKINAAAAAAGVDVTAGLATHGNGIRITDNTGGPNDLVVARANLSYAIDGLGLEKSSSTGEIVGDNVNGIVPNSIFTALHDLYEGLMGDDNQRVADAATRLEGFMRQTTRLQGEIGARSRAMSTRLGYTEDAVVSTTALLSDVKDLDYTEAITKFQQAQTTLQANLLTGSRIMQLSLMDFLS